MSHPTTPRDWGRRDLGEVPGQRDAHRSEAPTETEEILLLVEETATVLKRAVISGKVRARTIPIPSKNSPRPACEAKPLRSLVCRSAEWCASLNPCGPGMTS
jgi:hypothetical protein